MAFRRTSNDSFRVVIAPRTRKTAKLSGNYSRLKLLSMKRSTKSSKRLNSCSTRQYITHKRCHIAKIVWNIVGVTLPLAARAGLNGITPDYDWRISLAGRKFGLFGYSGYTAGSRATLLDYGWGCLETTLPFPLVVGTALFLMALLCFGLLVVFNARRSSTLLAVNKR